MKCPRCSGKTFGRDQHCFPCGLDINDVLPVAGDSDRRPIDVVCLPPPETPEEAEEDSPQARLFAVSTMTDAELGQWVAAQ